MQPDASVIELPRATKDAPPPSDGGEAASSGGKGPRAAKTKKPRKPMDWGRYNELNAWFALIYGTDTVIDIRGRIIMKVNALRLAFGTDLVKMWLNNPDRRMILPSQLVFVPDGDVDDGCVNLYSGLAMEPTLGDCAPLLELVQHLCGESAQTEQAIDAVIDWVLDWIAYPLQHPGAKMATALVFHGPQGTGKNLFFEAVAAIYGRYSIIVGQDQLEDKFNDWVSQKLFVIGDEVVARQELYHQKNKLKSLITGATIQINTKMLPLRTEDNHVNVVFLSNEQQPLALEQDDRRYMVIYTPPRSNDGLYDRVAECLEAGGAKHFLHYLLQRDLTHFGPHVRPLMTKAKADLIELGLRAPERFAHDWLKGYLPLPLQVCTAEQLYRAFTRWCRETGERFPPPQVTFSKALAKYARDQLTYRVIKLDRPDRGKMAARMWIPDGCTPPAGMTIGAWASDAAASFDAALADYFGRVNEVDR